MNQTEVLCEAMICPCRNLYPTWSS